MSWIAAAIGSGSGALLGYAKNEQDIRNEKARLTANAAQIQYSPWTHANAQVQGPTVGNSINAALGGAMQGGIAGATFGQQFNKGAAGPAGAQMAQAQPQASMQSPLGGQGYSNQLGAQASQFGQGQDDFWNSMNRKQTLYAGR